MKQFERAKRKLSLSCMEVGRSASNFYLDGRKAVLEKILDSIVEFDLDVEDGKVFFKKFFCALGPCLEGFRAGCRPYLSVDSTALNGRWSGHLPSATSVDGHNWMYHVAYGFWSLSQRKVGLGSCSNYGRLYDNFLFLPFIVMPAKGCYEQ
jgi:hypothetical protein